jgi:hypothetical protein
MFYWSGHKVFRGVRKKKLRQKMKKSHDRFPEFNSIHMGNNPVLPWWCRFSPWPGGFFPEFNSISRSENRFSPEFDGSFPEFDD